MPKAEIECLEQSSCLDHQFLYKNPVFSLPHSGPTNANVPVAGSFSTAYLISIGL
jgi:hypothetical protein